MRVESAEVQQDPTTETANGEVIETGRIYDERSLIRQLGFHSCRAQPIEVSIKYPEAMGEPSRVPPWLRGYYFLLVPSVFDIHYLATKWSWFGRVQTTVEKETMKQWGDVLCMLVKFEFTENQGMLYKSHLLATKAMEQWQNAQGKSQNLDGRRILQVLSEKEPRPWLDRSWKSHQKVEADAAVLQSSIVTHFSMGQYHGEDQRLVLHQTGSEFIQVIDSSTLRPRSLLSYQDIHQGFHGIPCPNPVFDSRTGELINVLTEFTKAGRPAKYHVVSMAKTSQVDVGRVLAIFQAPPANLQYFGVTGDYVIIPMGPETFAKKLPDCTGNIRQGWKDRLVFDQGGDTLFYLIDRRLHYLVGVYRSEACHIEGIVNVFQGSNELFIDVIARERPPSLEEDSVAWLREEDPIEMARREIAATTTLRRYALDNLREDVARFDGAAGQLSHFPLAKYLTLIDYPIVSSSINVAYKGIPYRYTYGLTVNRENRSRPGYLPNALVKCDLLSPNKSSYWYREGTFPIAPPTFIPNPDNALGREDDGVLLTVFTDILRQRSQLMIFDAKDLSLLAGIPLPGNQPLPICRVSGAWQPYPAPTLPEESLALAPLNYQ